MTEVAEPKPLDVKAAVRIAFQYVADLFPKSQVHDLRLEEVEKSEDDQFWLVTVGFSTPFVEDTTDPLQSMRRLASPLAAQRLRRDYKQLKINARDGSVVSMKIRVA